jgi:hypothetical protein
METYDEFVPITAVNNSNLLTGLFYTIHLKRWPDTFVTYCDNESASGKYMQIAWKQSEKYKPGCEWRDDALWCIQPSECAGYYSLTLKRWPTIFVTYTGQESPGGRFMQIAWKELNKYQQGGEWRDDALWHIKQSEVNGYSSLSLKRWPETYISYTDKESPSGKLMQLAWKELNRYNPGGDWRDDALFSFSLSDYKLKAQIQDFDYGSLIYNLNSIAQDVSAVVWSASNYRFENSVVHHPQINQRVINSSSWSFSRNNETSFYNKLDVNISASILSFSGGTAFTKTWENKTTSLEETKKAQLDETVVTLISDITVRPRKRMEYILTWKKVEADIPFTATVLLTGFADRLKKNGSIAKMAQVDGECVKTMLNQSGFRGNVITIQGNTVFARITGSVHVSGAIRGTIDTHEFDL